MKKGIIVALFACVFALSLALVGCGGGGGDVKAAWVGTWDLTEMEEGGQVTGSEDIEMLKGLGLTVNLELKEDGTGALVLFGESMDGKWEAKSATDATFTYEGQKITDGKLTMEQNGSKLTFVKGTASSASASAASASASAASASAASASASGSSSSAS